MREEYNIKELNPRKNPYVKKKQQITIKLDESIVVYFKNLAESIVVYFKNLAEESGISYQTLMNMYLSECVKDKKRPTFV